MSEALREQHEKTAVMLAYAGVAPFLIVTLLSLLHIGVATSTLIFVYYSLAILCFLGGAWWGFALVMLNAALSRSSQCGLIAGRALRRRHLAAIRRLAI